VSATQLIITDPRFVREVLAEAEREGIWVTAVRRGLHHSTVFRWRDRRLVDPAWPDADYIARWDAAAVRRAAGRDWARGYKHDRYRGLPRKIDATGSRRRLQALYALGWTSRQLGPRLGVSYARVGHLVNGMYPLIFRSTAERIRELYDELSMTVPQDPEVLAPQQVRVHARQRRLAVARGWVPPLAWDEADLDDPQATPATGATGDAREVDQSVIERILAGDWHARASVAERVEVARRWHAQGRVLRDLEGYTGWKVERYFKVGEQDGEAA
jgi:hypothetical protein